MKIEVGKTYRTRGGINVRVTEIDLQPGDRHPVCGRRDDGGGYGWWATDGRFNAFYPETQHDLDLVEEITLQPDAPGIFDESITETYERLGEEGAAAYRNHLKSYDNDCCAIHEVELHEDHLRMGRSVRLLNAAKAILFILLGIAAVTFSARAEARDLLWMPNDAGGEIVLTNARIPRCGEARVVIARAAGGRALVGCWAYTDSGYVAARFGDDLRMWKLEYFRMFEPVKAPARRELRL